MTGCVLTDMSVTDSDSISDSTVCVQVVKVGLIEPGQVSTGSSSQLY